MGCPNIKSPQWIALVDKIGFVKAFEEFRKHGDLIPPAENYTETIKGVDASTKIARALLHPKAQSLFKAFFNSDPDKFYLELMQNAGATRQQIELLKGLNERKQPATLVDMVSNLLSETSYVVEVQEAAELGDIQWEKAQTAGNIRSVDVSLGPNSESPTAYYSNLTVPGGTNYRENRIITPAIEPSIEGHAQFAERNDIGWFRSDDQVEGGWFSKGEMADGERLEPGTYSGTSTKTRRILELQSDLFQKSRGFELLVKDAVVGRSYFDTVAQQEYTLIRKNLGSAATYLSDENHYEPETPDTYHIEYEDGSKDDLYHEEFVKLLESSIRSPKEKAEINSKNEFLQLLNKDNNWVSFFVQAIIQDSVRRGYEKVLFPTGDTIAKIEGHETVQDFINTREKAIELREKEISKIEKQIETIDSLDTPVDNGELKASYITNIEGFQREIKQFKKELEDARNGTSQLSAIANFYQNNILNILSKRGFSPKPVVDEYGNTWNEVEVKPDYRATIFFNRDYDVKSMQYLVNKGLVEQVGEKYKVRKGEGEYISDSVAVIDMINKRYQQRHGIKPFAIIHESDGSWSVELQVKHNRITPSDNRGMEVMSGLVARLQQRFGIASEIVSVDKAIELLGDRYNGEGAFFFNGQVYLVEGRVNMDNYLHEYSHPLVMAIRLMNPRAYNNLVNEIQNSLDPNVLTILGNVRELYPEYSEDSYEFKDEVMVRIIAANALDTLNQSTFKTFLQKLWYRLKELLRSIFGDNRDLSKLSAKTTLKDLADMLSLGYSKIDVQTEQSEYVLFNRELARELESIPDSLVMRNIEMFKAVITKHLQKLHDGRNYGALRDILKNESDGSIYSDMNSMLRAVKDLEGSIEENFVRLRAFANSIIGAKMVSQKMKEHVLSMRDSTIPEQEQLRILTYYNTIVDEWSDTFDELRKSNAQDFPLLRTEIMQASDNLKTIKDYTMDVYEHGVVDLLVKELKPLKEEADREYITRLESLAVEADNGNVHAATMHARLTAEYKKFNYDEEFVRSMLRGEKGDTSRFSGFLMSYTNSPDPIIGGFATFMKKNFMRVESIIQEMSTKFRNELKDPYKALGVHRSDPAELGKQLVANDKIPGRDENGNIYAHDVYVLMNEFHNGWLYDYKIHEGQVDAAKEKGDESEIQEAIRKFEQFKEDYFHREYLDEVYAARKYWETNDITRRARDERAKITNELKTLEQLQDQGQEYDEEDMQRIEDLQKQLRQLRSLRNPDGTDKVAGHEDPFQNLEIAQALQHYSNLTKDFYQDFEIKGAFKRAHDNYEEVLIDKGIVRGSDEFNSAMSNWIRNNVRFKLSEEFYTKRQEIIDEIGRVLAKLGPKTSADLDISNRWKSIFDVIRGLRDQDGQPIGTDINDAKAEEVKRIQEEINKIRDQLTGLSGLTPAEEQEVSNYLEIVQSGQELTQEQYARYTEMINRRDTLGLDPAEKGYLFAMFNTLKDFQSKIPTEYYIDSFNEQLSKFNIPLEMTVHNSEWFLDEANIGPWLDANPEFETWFVRHHLYKGNQWNNVTKEYDSKYERTYIWNRIIPNDPRIKDALSRRAYNDLYTIQSPLFEAKHASKYYFYRIKNKYKTGFNPSTEKVETQIGVHKDNRGNWLPKLSASDRKYINEDFIRLKDADDPRSKELFKILEIMKKYHLGVQKSAPRYGRLWMEIPRRRKERIEVLQEAKDSPTQFAKSTWKNVVADVKVASDDFNRNLMRPQDIKDETKLYVMTDLFGNEIQSIPVRFMSKLEKDVVSLDIFGSIMRYAASLENNKMLHDINPLARALENNLSANGVAATNKMATTAWLAKHFNISVKASENTRLQILRNMLERDIEGIQNRMEIGVFGHKVANHVMALAAFGSLALNIPGGVKNLAVARIQNVLEAVSGRHFTGKEWLKASGEFLHRVMPKLIRDYNAFADKSLETQMWEIFDPVEGKFGENIGAEGNASKIRDFVDFKWSTSPQKFGEINAQGSAWLAMMRHQKVPQTINEKTTEIPYSQAWELRDGLVQLKIGIPEEWGRTGEKFLAFKAKVHKVNELLQGAYAPLNQPEAQRYTLLKLLLFMRKYFAPGLVNRFGIKNPNVPLGQFREGYYITWAKAFKAQVKYMVGKTKDWHLYSEEEKRAVWRTWVEMGYSMFFLAFITLVMGFGADDDDRFKKLERKNWAQQMLLYEMMMIKSETETFLPLPGMGLNELLRMKDNPSIAFPLINRYAKILSHSADIMIGTISGTDQGRYERKSGIWEKGDIKVYADLLKLVGYTGNTQNPDIALKNYTQLMNRYD